MSADRHPASSLDSRLPKIYPYKHLTTLLFRIATWSMSEIQLLHNTFLSIKDRIYNRNLTNKDKLIVYH